MKASSLWRGSALLMVVIFSAEQICYSEGVMSSPSYSPQPSQPGTYVLSSEDSVVGATATETTTDFLSSSSSPLSLSQNGPQQTDPYKTYDSDGKLRSELSLGGRTTRHVFQGELVQAVIDQSLAGDMVFLHAGIYHEKIVLRKGIQLRGEDPKTTVLHGDFQPGGHVLRALGDNYIESLTITGGGAYAGVPSSAVRVEGDNVKIRHNRIVDNKDYGIHLWEGADTVIEMNFFQSTHVAIQLPKDTTVIRHNTFVKNDIAVNILNGARPRVVANIFTESTFQSIYEFSWSAYSNGQLSRGFAAVEGNSFWKNTEKGSYYGSATPPAAANQIAGNLKADPGFVNASLGDYSLHSISGSYGRGAFLPEALTAALDRASTIPSKNTIHPILDRNVSVGYQVVYEEGSTEEFYNDGRRILDTIPPEIEIPTTIVFTNQPEYELVYWVEGVEKREFHSLNEGENTFSLSAADIFGNKSSRDVVVTLDQTPPEGALNVNDGDEETDSRAVVLSVSGTDRSPLKDVRFSVDQGVTWTDWGEYSGMKVAMLSEGEGEKDVWCELRDAAGNSVSFSDKIRFSTAPAKPVVQFLSSPMTESPLYVLRYIVNGQERQETWRLQPGENRLMVCASLGSAQTFAEFGVTWDPPTEALPSIPALPPSKPEGLFTMKTQDGFVLGYSSGGLFSIEKPGDYTLYQMDFSAEGALLGGLLFFQEGERLLYRKGKPFCRVTPFGEKTVYNEDGTIAHVITQDNKKVRYVYEFDDAGQVVSILSSEENVTSLYDERGKPVWVKKNDGTAMLYEDGYLTTYIDGAGNSYHYEVSILHENEALTGYRSELTSVILAGTGTTLSMAVVLADLANHPSLRVTLENQTPKVLEYDVDGNLKRAVSVKGEALELQGGKILSFTDQEGDVFLAESSVAGDEQFFSLSLDGGDLVQTFGPDGKLRELRMSDGTLLKVTGTRLDRLDLEDGSSLTQLAWNGQNLTGFTRIYPDGSQDLYRNSRIVTHEDAQGTVSSFHYPTATGHPSVVTMGDGRVYSVREVQKAEGLIERSMELVSMPLPEGASVQFQDGQPVRYSLPKFVPGELGDIPDLLAGRFFVPLVQLTDAQLRELTVDQYGTIFSGQILFNDGTQYLIEDQKIVKQITAFGQLIALDQQDLPPIQSLQEIPVAPLTVQEETLRDELIETQLDYFTNGRGIHAGTGLPVDNYLGTNGQQSDYSQATLVGFWAEILSAIATGDHETAKISEAEAFARLEQLLTTYREVQQQAGWNGMVSFFDIVAKQKPVLDASGNPTALMRTVYEYTNSFDQVGFGDVLNLSVSLASVIGALEGRALAPELASQRDRILAQAHAILAAQEAGYAAFYDPVNKRFRGAYGRNETTGRWEFIPDYYIDRTFNEFRTGMVWLVSRYPQYAEALKNLDVAIRPYKTKQGDWIDIAAPYDGGTFQMFWPLIHVDEAQYPEFRTALRNFLYSQSELVHDQGIPGLLSAGDEPLRGYQGKIGLPAAAETDDLLKTDIGSLYGTAAAFPLAPHYALQFLKNIKERFPGISTSAGFVDAIQMKRVTREDLQTGESVVVEEPVYADRYYGVDQAAFILSLLKTSQNYFTHYLHDTGSQETFDGIYRSLQFNLNPITEANLSPPEFGLASGVLYDGLQAWPDGLSQGLVKQPGFVSTLLDPELGEGKVFNYVTASGSFHHMEIEFGEGNETRGMNLQEYFLSPKHSGAATALLGGVALDILNQSDSQGVFFTPSHGYSMSALTMDPEIGQVRRLEFDFQDSRQPVGIWANYSGKDFSDYDFLSVPFKLGEGTPGNIRLKFEMKGMGQVIVTGALTREWNYLSIPLPKAFRGLSQLAISIQPCDGQPIAGTVFLGPLSAMKIRTSNRVNWEALLNRSEAEIRELIVRNISAEGNLEKWFWGEDVLENFAIDAAGKLVSGVLKLADGGIQYFQKGQLVKWIFENGRTVLFEKGLASFVVDLARGKLETGRFYYDQDLRGEIRSFVLRDNESERVFAADGQLKSFVKDGLRVLYEKGRIQSILVPEGTLQNPEFSSEGGLLKAHVLLLDGTEFDIDQTQSQTIDVGGGVRVTYRGSFIEAIETPQNGRTGLGYSLDIAGRVMGVQVSFRETIIDPQTGQSQALTRQMSLFEYLQRPERSVERAYLLEEDPVSILADATVSGFSDGILDPGEVTQGSKSDEGLSPVVTYRYKYLDSLWRTLGVSIRHDPISVSAFDFLRVTFCQDPSMSWSQDFTLKLKSPSGETLSAFAVPDVSNDDQTCGFPVSDKMGIGGEIDLEIVREPAGANKTGTVFLKDISFVSLRTLGRELWEERIGVTSAELQRLKTDADQLVSVGMEIASRKPLVYSNLTPFFDIPTQLLYSGDITQTGQLTRFKRFDGSQVEVNGDRQVTRVILPNGIVNEYEISGNVAQATILGLGENPSDARTVSYNYGALRRIVQPGGQEYLLSYESDGEGKEVTVFKDTKSGTERRFKEGKLIFSDDADELRTRYTYEGGQLTGAELTYRNRVLNSTKYFFDESGTQVTDERGTIWFYDANGDLVKHMTREGYLYEYSDYTQEFLFAGEINAEDYKNALCQTSGLRAVSLRGYQAEDGSWIRWEGASGPEIHLASGEQGLNLEFDEDQKIRSGQIYFSDGMILEIEDFIPVHGRLPSGQFFEYHVSSADAYELLQDETGAYLGFRFQKGDTIFTYDKLGTLSKTESERGITNTFSCEGNATGSSAVCSRLEHRQIAFNGVPFPKETRLIAGSDQRLLDSGEESAVHTGPGFLAAVYKEATNQWDVFSGSFSSGSDRLGIQHFLSEIKPGEFVAVTVSDPAFSLAGEEVFSLLAGLGAGQVRSAAQAPNSWSFFGNETLGAGQGFENVGGSSFSTVVEAATTQSFTADQTPLFLNEKMFLNMSEVVSDVFSGFLKGYESLKAPRDLQAVTVYNPQDAIVFSRRLDGINSYYEQGKVRETFDKEGTLLSVQEYGCPVEGCESDDDLTLQKITLVKARQDFEAEAVRLREQIEQAQFDALYRLAWQDDVARLQIRENMDSGVAQINGQIASLSGQRFQTVKQCRRFLFWKSCSEHTYEVPGVQAAINGLVAQRAELLIVGEAQLAAIPGAIAARKLEIEQATGEKLAELLRQKEGFLLDILHQEMEPIVTDLYRRVLGRDASQREFDDVVHRSRGAGRLDVALLRSELLNSSEKTAREEQKQRIIQGVRGFLESYVALAPESKAPLLQSLQLDGDEAVVLEPADISGILRWLEARDLHFGQSAFLSLKEMLRSKGVDVAMETIGKEAILIDVLTGAITRFTEGDLLISMFALDRVAKVHGRDFATVKFSYQNLSDLFHSVCPDLQTSCALRVIAHVGEDHFVVLKRVTDAEVIYEETGKGASGEDLTVRTEDFLKIWEVKDRSGYLLVSEEHAISEKKVSDQEAMEVRGAFFFIFFVSSFVLSVASMIVSTFSPAFGKILGYAALVAGILGIVGSLGQFIVQGVKMVFSSIASQGVFATIKQGMAYVGKVLFESVKSVGRFVQKAFVFIKGGCSGGLSGFGAGLMKIKDFLLKPAVDIIQEGTVIGQKFSLAQTMTRSLVAAGLNWGVAKGLEGLGLDPQLTQLAGAFVGGAFLGIGQTSTSFLRSGVSQVMLQGVSQVAVHLGLAPPFAEVFSLAGNIVLGSFFDPSFNLKSTLTSIAPTLASKLTLGGIELLGRSLGLDPRLTQLLGLPLAALTGNIVSDYLNKIPIQFTVNGIFATLSEALSESGTLGGLFSIGAEFVIDKLELDESLLGSASSRLLAGLFGDFIASPMRFSFVDSMIKSLDESVYHFMDTVMLPQIFDLIQDQGFLAGIERYAIGLFTKETLQEFTGAGESLQQWILRGIPLAEDIVYEGESAKLLKLQQNGKSINFIYIPKGERLEICAIYEQYSNGRRPRFVSWNTDGHSIITEVLVTEQMSDGTFRTDRMDSSGEIREVIFCDWSGEVYGRLSFNATRGLEFTNYNLGISDYLDSAGNLTFDFTVTPNLQDLDQLVYNFNTDLSPESVSQLAGFSFGPGFWNSHQSVDAVSPTMGAFMLGLVEDQGRNGTPGIVLFDENGDLARDRHGNILTTGALPVTLYEETGLVGNVLRWAADTWFGCDFMRDEIERELAKYFDLIELNQRQFGLAPGMSFVHFSHSGNFQPMIEALEHMEDKYRSRIKALVVYEGPYVGDGVIDDPYLETLVRVKGLKSLLEVPMIEPRDFQITDAQGNVMSVPHQYNIEIGGASHDDFSYDPSFEYPSDEAREIARKTNLFMRELTLAAAEGPAGLNDFLSLSRGDRCVTRDGSVYKIDPVKFLPRLETT